MSDITNLQYWQEVRELASDIIVEVMGTEPNDFDEALDEYLFQTIDGHQWVIYYAYNLDVIRFSANADYFEDNIGGADDVLKEGGIDRLHTVMAFWALYGDVSEAIQHRLADVA